MLCSVKSVILHKSEYLRVFYDSHTYRYDRGCEVFNSYGRRPNDNLLLDYGFSMMGNEWDEVGATIHLCHLGIVIVDLKIYILYDCTF